ncbi:MULTISPECIES: hydantoinase/oxoprolinase family protein [unclassified Ensifer]|uniref:hydantoinase/oxoprolinase N-terminal domain-containing protein n=1 Tax=unclassified Ensifer TaxID=2633371 RepID=UPI0008131551|nr:MULTISPECIES: hydantoinase/oxoprolinase family protein [unclassified Ensifer]OCP25169.1 hydantoinase subunit beta [Ensifer sp. LC54]OCP25498.1 hydantoinase subunit beta [Ensifer sp. LC384]
MTERLRIGVDVGGTNTDAALLRGNEVLATVKTATTENVTDGVSGAIRSVLSAAGIPGDQVGAVMIGTTHFLNALVERRRLQRTGVLRLCGSSTRALPPMIDWPEDLRLVVDGGAALVGGGVNYDGSAIASLDADAIRQACRDWRDRGIGAIAICSVFALVDSRMEQEAAAIVSEELPGASISLSHRIGRTGLLQRESAAILNASLHRIGHETIAAFRQAFGELGLSCPLYLTQNDGTLMSADYAERFPVFTIASGPTNSMRGAAFLTGLKDAVVIDIGGTTTDIGMLIGGFPRSRGEGASIAGVPTNFRVPDVFSFGLGGGSLVRDEGGLRIGPESVGFRLPEKALCFGGDTLTATDVAAAAGLVDLGDKTRLKHLDGAMVAAALAKMKSDVEAVVDQMKPGPEPIPAILVGGGSVLVDGLLEGTSVSLRPDHFGSANAIGAAIAQVSGEVDNIVSLDGQSRQAALDGVIAEARRRAVEAGAAEATVTLAEIDETPLSYLPGNAMRIAAKVVGDLNP